jgi:hypothetical protein
VDELTVRPFKPTMLLARVQPQEAGVASISNRMRGRRGALAVVLAAGFALGPSTAGESWNGPTVTRAPWIQGTTTVGQSLWANGGTWSGPSGTQVSYQWLRCTDPSNMYSCSLINGATGQGYKLVNDDSGKRMRVALVVRYGNSYDYGLSGASNPVTAAASAPAATPTPAPQRTPTPAPQRTPVPTPTPTPTPTPPPSTQGSAPVGSSFDVAAVPVPTPVGTSGEVLHQTATSKKARMMHPFPTIRVMGKLTAEGANVTSLTVRAPRGARISVSCAGSSCKRRSFARSAKITRLSPLQHVWKAGTRMTIKVTKRGYVSKVTVITIRRGAVPTRYDGCLYPGHKKTQRCPGD